MYDIQLEINGKKLSMNPGNGYYISTISGLTGVTANLELSQSNSGIGESFSGGSIKGISLQVKGKILDGQTDKKQALLDTVVPLGTGTLSLYEKSDEIGGRAKPYRVTDIVVKSTPTITQENNSKFVFTLYAPSPAWREATVKTVGLDGFASAPTEVTVAGQVPADYTLKISVTTATKMKEFTLYQDWPDAVYGKSLYVNFRKWNADGVSNTDKILIKQTNGRLSMTINGVNANECIWTQSGMTRLDVGTHTMLFRADAASTATLEFAPSYIGVVYNGI